MDTFYSCHVLTKQTYEQHLVCFVSTMQVLSLYDHLMVQQFSQLAQFSQLESDFLIESLAMLLAFFQKSTFYVFLCKCYDTKMMIFDFLLEARFSDVLGAFRPLICPCHATCRLLS